MTDTLTPEQIAEFERMLAEQAAGVTAYSDEIDRLLLEAAPALLSMAKQTHESFRIGLMYRDHAEKAEAERDAALAGAKDNSCWATCAIEDMKKAEAERDRYRERAVRLARRIECLKLAAGSAAEGCGEPEFSEFTSIEADCPTQLAEPDIAELLKEEIEE